MNKEFFFRFQGISKSFHENGQHIFIVETNFYEEAFKILYEKYYNISKLMCLKFATNS